SSSRTTCSRQPACRTSRRTCTLARWWSSASPTGCSSSRRRSRPRTTSRAGSDNGGQGTTMGISEHASKQYDLDLDAIRSRVLQMGGLVESQTRRALDALATGDRALIDEIIANDHRVNAMEVELDGDCSQV